MSRVALVAIASLVTVAAACGPAPAPLTEVDVYWEFDRNTWIDGVDGTVPYDTAVNWPPGTGSRSCPQSGVDFVTVTDGAGNPLTGNVPCVNSSVQGVVLTGFAGANSYVVTGWRTGIAVPLYRGSVTVNVVNGTPTYGTAIAAGIPSDLTISAILVDASSGPSGYPTCGLAGIDEFQAAVVDGYGTLVWRTGTSTPVICGLSAVPGVSYGPVDRDDLWVWMQAIDNRVNPPDVHWSICDYGGPANQGIQHFTPGEDWFSLALPLGACGALPPI